MISRPNVEKLIRMADLDLNIKSKPAQEALVDGLMKSLTIKSASRDNLYTLAYDDQEDRSGQSGWCSRWLPFLSNRVWATSARIRTLPRSLSTTRFRYIRKNWRGLENRLKEFRLKNLSMQNSDGEDYFGRIGEVNSVLERSKLELREAENARDALKRQIVGEEPVLLPYTPEATAGISLPEIDGRIDAMKRNLDGLLQRFTDQRPMFSAHGA